MLLFSRQGKLRLQKWYVAHPDKLKKKITRELITTILARKPKMSSFLEWKDVKVVYKRYCYWRSTKFLFLRKKKKKLFEERHSIQEGLIFHLQIRQFVFLLRNRTERQ